MRSFSSGVTFGAAASVVLAACGDDATRDGTGGAGGAGGTTSAETAVSTGLGVTASSTSTQVSSAFASTSSGAGGAGGEGGTGGGGGDASLCAPADTLPGASDDCGEGGSTPDDCATPENEGCTARTLCGDTIVFPVAAGDVLFGQVGDAVGIVADDLTFEPLLEDVIVGLQGTDPLGFAYAVVGDGESAADFVRLSRDGEIAYRRQLGGLPFAEGDTSGNVVLWNQGSAGPLSPDEPIADEGEEALHGLDDTGMHRWSRRYGVEISGFGFEFRDFAVEAESGDIAVVGRYDGEVDFGPEPLPIGSYGFIARVDGDSGDVEWVTTLPDPNFTPNGVLFAPDGTIVAVGDAFDDETFSKPGIVVRLAGDGEIEWTRELGGDEPHFVYLFDATLVGDALIIVGGMDGTVVLEDLTATSAGVATEPLLLRVDVDGTPRWVRTLDVTSTDDFEIDAPASLYAVTPLCGRAYVGGSFDGPSIANLDGIQVVNDQGPGGRAPFALEIAIDP